MCIRDRYDAFGIPLETTEQLNNRIRYTGQQYDDVKGQYYLLSLIHLLYEKASDAEGKHTNISTWHYDSLGRVTRAVCDGKSYDYIYDAHGLSLLHIWPEV